MNNVDCLEVKLADGDYKLKMEVIGKRAVSHIWHQDHCKLLGLLYIPIDLSQEQQIRSGKSLLCPIEKEKRFLLPDLCKRMNLDNEVCFESYKLSSKEILFFNDDEFLHAAPFRNKDRYFLIRLKFDRSSKK